MNSYRTVYLINGREKLWSSTPSFSSPKSCRILSLNFPNHVTNHCKSLYSQLYWPGSLHSQSPTSGKLHSYYST
uniref:Uncharacterized protein n=1 Tax=Kalanchoe fedtschenkoi TaxID=63787 RepID=A0A7N0ZYI8_KALFE